MERSVPAMPGLARASGVGMGAARQKSCMNQGFRGPLCHVGRGSSSTRSRSPPLRWAGWCALRLPFLPCPLTHASYPPPSRRSLGPPAPSLAHSSPHATPPLPPRPPSSPLAPPLALPPRHTQLLVRRYRESLMHCRPEEQPVYIVRAPAGRAGTARVNLEEFCCPRFGLFAV